MLTGLSKFWQRSHMILESGGWGLVIKLLNVLNKIIYVSQNYINYSLTHQAHMVDQSLYINTTFSYKIFISPHYNIYIFESREIERYMNKDSIFSIPYPFSWELRTQTHRTQVSGMRHQKCDIYDTGCYDLCASTWPLLVRTQVPSVNK